MLYTYQKLVFYAGILLIRGAKIINGVKLQPFYVEYFIVCVRTRYTDTHHISIEKPTETRVQQASSVLLYIWYYCLLPDRWDTRPSLSHLRARLLKTKAKFFKNTILGGVVLGGRGGVVCPVVQYLNDWTQPKITGLCCSGIYKSLATGWASDSSS